MPSDNGTDDPDPSRFAAIAQGIKPLGPVRTFDRLTAEEHASNAAHDEIMLTVHSSVTPKRAGSDEHYVIDICDAILGERAKRGATFEWLKGDSGRRLPVDAYYETHSLVVEYHEIQHSLPVPLFDKRATVSGVSRGEQRRMYDDRRREVLPAHGIRLLVISYSQLQHRPNRRLMKLTASDEAILRASLTPFIAESNA
jgi:hypothetical protein